MTKKSQVNAGLPLWKQVLKVLFALIFGGWWRFGFCPTPGRGDILGLVEWVVAGDRGGSAARREVGLR